MSEIRIAANLIEFLSAVGVGHLQLVLVDDQGNQLELEVQSPQTGWPYYFTFPSEHDHTTGSNYNVTDKYYYTKLDIGDRSPEDVWVILQNIHNSYIQADGSGLDVVYGPSKNSNSYINTLLGAIGVDLQDYLPNLHQGLITSTPGSLVDILQTDAIPLVLTGTTGDDTLRGGLLADEFFGGAGDDLIFGRQGDDTFHSSAGADRLFGGDDNDTFKLDVYGKDFAIGGEGNDVFEFDCLAPWDPTVDFNNLAGTYNPTIVWGGGGADEFRFTKQAATTVVNLAVVVDFDLTEEDVKNLDYSKIRDHYFNNMVSNYNEYPEVIIINPTPEDFITFDGYRLGGASLAALVVHEETWQAPSGHEAGDRWYGYGRDGWVYDPLAGGVTTSPSTYQDKLWFRELTTFDSAGRPEGYPRVSILGFRDGDFGIEFDSPVLRHHSKGVATNWDWEPQASAGHTAWSEMYGTSRFSFPFSTFTLPQPAGNSIQGETQIGSTWASYGGLARETGGYAVYNKLDAQLSAPYGVDLAHYSGGSGTSDRLERLADGHGPRNLSNGDHGAEIDGEPRAGSDDTMSLTDIAANTNYPSDLWYEPEPIGGVV